MTDLLFFAELLLHLCRYNVLDVVAPTSGLLKISDEFDFFNEQVAHLSVLCVKLVELHKSMVQLLN